MCSTQASNSKKQLQEWQDKIEKNFIKRGVVGGNLVEILEMEEEYGVFIASTFHGHLVLLDSFFSFFIETIRKALDCIRKNGWPRELPNYGFLMTFFITNFRSFRAADKCFVGGYPLDGYALLRDLKDRAIYLGAVVQNITTLSRLYGYECTGSA